MRHPERVVVGNHSLTGLYGRVARHPLAIGGKLQMELLTSHKPISRDSVLPDIRNTTAERRGRAHTHRLAGSHFA